MSINPTHNSNDSWKKKIALFLISQNISLFGSSVVGFAIIWHITLKTSSGLWLMLATICYTLPQVFISVWGGVWADRYNRKYLIMLSDGFIALATLGLAVAFWLGFQRMELLLLVSVVRSLGSGIQMPAVNAIFPQLVPPDKLTKVQGINQTLNSILLLLSPAVGGVVLGSFGIVWTFMLDVTTAALAIIVTSFISIGKVSRSNKASSFSRELREGIAYTFKRGLIRSLVICYGFSFFLITPAAILTPLLVERSFGSDVWRLTANEMTWTIGSLIGGIFVSLRKEFKDKILTIAICLGAFGITFALLGIASNFVIYLAIMSISGFFTPIMTTAQIVLIQENVEASMMGRVFSILQMIGTSAMPVAILFFGPLADVVSVESILIVSGILLTIVAIVYRISTRQMKLGGLSTHHSAPVPIEASQVNSTEKI